MAREVDLLNYLPTYVSEYREIKEIMNSMSQEVQALVNSVDTFKDNLFIYTTNEKGIERYEQLVGITPLDTDTLSDRQYKVVSKWNVAIPYTMRSLQEKLSALCGGNDKIQVEMVDTYSISVKVGLTEKNKLEATDTMVKNLIPCNMTYEVILMYNTHGLIGAYPNKILEQLTYDEMNSTDFSTILDTSVSNVRNYTVSEIGYFTNDDISLYGLRKRGT